MLCMGSLPTLTSWGSFHGDAIADSLGARSCDDPVMLKVAAALALACCLSLPTAGAAAAGGRFYPMLGNEGYDVESYALWLRWSPPSDTEAAGFVDAQVTIGATATDELSTIALD